MFSSSSLPQPSISSFAELVKETLYQSYPHPYVVIDSDNTIVHSQGNLQPFVKLSHDVQPNLLEGAAPELRSILQALLLEMTQQQTLHTLSCNTADAGNVQVCIQPVAAVQNSKLFLVTFKAAGHIETAGINSTQPEIYPKVQARQDQLELMAGIASSLASASSQELEKAVATALEKIGMSLDATGMYLTQADQGLASAAASISWIHPAVEAQHNHLVAYQPDIAWFIKHMPDFTSIQLWQSHHLPASSWKHVLQTNQISSVLLAPLLIGPSLVGVLEIWHTLPYLWPKEDLTYIKAAAASLSNAIFRKNTEDKIKRNEKRLQQFQQVAKLGSWEFDTQIKNVKWSEETYRIYGYLPTQDATFCFKDVLRRKPQLERIQFKRMITAALRKKKPYNYDIQVVTPENEVKYAQVIGQPLEDDNGKVIKLHGMILDITERKQAEDRLKTALQQKEVLLKEVYHRVKNNLAMVEGLLFLQKNLITDQKYIDIFDECEKRIHSMALIHRNLYQSENLNTIDINKYINELVQHIAMSSARRNEVEINITVKAVLFDLNLAIPLGLITNELVTNSFKYAFRNIEKPQLTVSLIQHKGKYEFTVKDNGSGFELRPEHERNTLGISLVTMLTGDLNGEIFFNSEQGSETKIIF